MTTLALNRMISGRPFWKTRRRPNGDAPVTCLIIIVAIIAIGIFCYYYFFQNKALDNAGQDVTIVKKLDPTAVNAYRLRVRDKFVPLVRVTCDESRKALMPVIKGKVKSASDVESEFNQLDKRLHEAIEEINSQGCLQKYADMHRKLARSIGYNWQALKDCKQALKEDDLAAKKRLLESAQKNLNNAKREYTAANALCNKMFNK